MAVKVSNQETPLITGSPVGSGRSRGPSGIQEGEISVPVSADPTPEDLRAWEGIQIPYVNLAGKNKDRDDRALDYVQTVLREFQEENLDIYDTWMLIRRLMNSMQAHQGEGEVAELYMAMERMVPRIEEQVLGMDEWFKSSGRDKADKDQTSKIDSFLSAQLAIDRFRSSVQPAIRTMLSYGFVATKTRWCIETEERVKRVYSKTMVEGKETLHCRLTKEDQVTFNGPRGGIVDPFSFFIDTDCTEVRDAMYVGDISEMTLDEILDMEKRGVFSNTKGLEDETPLSRSDYNGWRAEECNRNGRTTTFSHGAKKAAQGGPKQFYVTELWGLFDLYGTGRTRECVITVVNFRRIVRLQENPYDDKHRPYAVGRANRDAFSFFSIGPFDNAVNPQLSMNENRSIAERSHKQSLAPILLMSDQGDMPDSLWEVEPGQVLTANAQALASLTQIQAKSTLPEMRHSDMIYQSNIEEITGSTRLLSGTEDSGTATESTQKLSESSRRLRAYVQSYVMMLNDMLEQFHALNGQYVTGPMKFKVLGKDAKGLDAYDMIDPEVLQTRVDFEFAALGSLHSGDLMATQLMQFLNLTAPISAKHPGMVNEPLILQILAKHVVGGVDAKDIVHIPTRAQDLLSQEEENWMLEQGQKVAVDPLDDDEEHMDTLLERFTEIIQSPTDGWDHPSLSMDAITNIRMHYEEHVIQWKQKRAEAKRDASGAGGPFARPAAQLDAGRGTTGERRMPEPGGVQSKEGSATGGVGSHSGMTNGAANMGQVPAADRTSGFFQTENNL